MTRKPENGDGAPTAPATDSIAALTTHLMGKADPFALRGILEMLRALSVNKERFDTYVPYKPKLYGNLNTLSRMYPLTSRHITRIYLEPCLIQNDPANGDKIYNSFRPSGANHTERMDHLRNALAVLLECQCVALLDWQSRDKHYVITDLGKTVLRKLHTRPETDRDPKQQLKSVIRELRSPSWAGTIKLPKAQIPTTLAFPNDPISRGELGVLKMLVAAGATDEEHAVAASKIKLTLDRASIRPQLIGLEAEEPTVRNPYHVPYEQLGAILRGLNGRQGCVESCVIDPLTGYGAKHYITKNGLTRLAELEKKAKTTGVAIGDGMGIT